MGIPRIGWQLGYAEITSLQIGGRGDIVTTTTSGTRWVGGGIGPTGITEGVLLSKVLNALSSRTIEHHSVETVVHLLWTSGSLTLLNTTHVPTAWASILRPVMSRIEALQQTAQAGEQDHLAEKVCPYCAETIKAAAIKCRYCWSNLEHLDEPQA